MVEWTNIERTRILELHFKCGSIIQAQRDFKRIYVNKCPSRNSALLWLQANLKDNVSRLSASHSHMASCMADSRVGSPKGWHIKKKKAERGKEDITPRKHKLTNACHPNNPLTRGKGQSTKRLMKLEGHSVEHIPLPRNAWSTRTYLVQHIFEILCYISV